MRSENLDIQIFGINEFGYEAGNELIPDVSDLPWLQDVDENGDGVSDVWTTQWNVVYRDVVIVDQNNMKLGAFNVTEHNLADAENYATLKQALAHVADANPIWQNDADPMDVNDDGAVSPVGDVLACINELNNHTVSDERGVLPVPGPTSEHAYFDVNGDYRITPVGDVLALVNYLNSSHAGEGEASWLAAPPITDATLVPDWTVSIVVESTEHTPVTSALVRATTADWADQPSLLTEAQRSSESETGDASYTSEPSGLDEESVWRELFEDLANQWYSE